MGFKGSVESFSLADVFQNLAMNQQTGTLSVVASDSHTSAVYFCNGTVHAVSHGNGNSLPSLLAFYARGMITAAQMQEAAENIKNSRAPVPAALVELGFLTDIQAKDTMRLRVEEEIFDLFSWEHAQFEFNDGEPPPGVFDVYALEHATPMPISPLIMEAARRVDEWERLSQQVPSLKEFYTVDAMLRRAVERGEMEMEPFERRLVALMDGTRDVEDIAIDSGLYKFEILNAIAGFIQSSLVRPCSVEELSLAEQECARTHQPARRIKILERILAGGENARVRRELAELLARENRVENACVHFHVLAELELKGKREEGAMEIYKRILDLNPKNVKGHEKLAEIYSKRGQKKEARIHYNELFETYKDQNHLKEARAAAVCALDCDPANSQLRGQLIEMLLAENQKEDAARQYETLGDHLAKAGDVKGAADAYRRALQFFGTSNRLKKKLGDVMLSREDRGNRTRYAIIAVAVILVLVGVGGFLFYKERQARLALDDARERAKELLAAAVADESQQAYQDARLKYNDAISAYALPARMFSPFMSYNKEAQRRADEIRPRVKEAERLAATRLQNNAKQAEDDLEAAIQQAKTLKFFDAREILQRILQNPQATAHSRKSAEDNLAEIEKKISIFEAGMARLKKNPNEAFADVFEESAFKTRFVSDYEMTGRIRRTELEMPLLVKSETDGVKVYLNGKLAGTVNIGTDRVAATFRYPSVGNHSFEFRREGYATMGVTTGELRSPVVTVRLRREPASRIDVRPLLGADVTLRGTPVWYDNGILAGTSDGALLHIREGEQTIVRKHALPPEKSLNRELYGKPLIVQRPGQPDVIVYSTFAGELSALTVEPNGFKPLWPSAKVTDRPLTAAPSIVQVALLTGKTLIAMPSDKKLVLIDLDTGARALGDKVLQTRAPITSPAVAITADSLVLVGCQDGKLYGLSLNELPGREWNTGSDASAIRAEPQFFENQIITPSENGQVYVFTPSRGGFGERIAMENAGAIHAGLLAKRRLYFGTSLKEGLWCADIPSRRAIWKKTDPELGNIYGAPALLENTLFFGNDRATVFAVDAEKGFIKWTYQFDGGRPMVGSPMINGRRVYFVNTDGRILAFDE